MSDPDDNHNENVIFDFVYDSVHTDSYSVSWQAREFCVPNRARVFTERLDSFGDGFDVRLGKFFDRLPGRSSDF